MLKISIPTPCHEDWTKMTPTEKGAFCKVCSKDVVDFTLLSDDEEKNYFIQYKGQKTCGRFYNHQLTQSEPPAENIIFQDIPLWKKFLAAVVICFGSLLTGCNERTIGKLKADDINTIGVIMPEIKTLTDTVTTTTNREETNCSITGDVMPVVIETETTVGIIPPPEEIFTGGTVVVEEVPDTIKPVNPNNQVITAPDKKCDLTAKNDTLYYRP